MARIPAKVSGYQSAPINAIIEYLHATKLMPSADLVATQTHNGLSLGIAKKKRVSIDFPYKLTVGGNEIRVEKARYTRYGTPLTSSVEAGKTYKAITQPGDPAAGAWAASTTYYVYVKLESSTGQWDPALGPDQISFYATTALPADVSDIGGNIYTVLGTVDTDSNAILKQPEQWRWGGDIDNIALVPDGNSPFATDGSEYRYYSLEFCATLARGKYRRNLQIYEWDSPTEATPESDDLFMFQDVSENNLYLRYVTLSNLATAIANDPTGIGVIADELNNNNLIHHTDLDYSDVGSGWAAKGTGKAGYNTDHDESYWRTFADGSFVDSKTFKTTGGIYANDLFINDAVTNRWGNDAFNVNVVSAIILNAGTELQLDAAGGAITGTASTSIDFFATTDVNLQATTANNVSGATVLIQSNSGQVNLAPSGELQINGTAGVTGDGYTKGIKTSEAAADAHIVDVAELYL